MFVCIYYALYVLYVSLPKGVGSGWVWGLGDAVRSSAVGVWKRILADLGVHFGVILMSF